MNALFETYKTKLCSDECGETIARTSQDYRANVFHYTQLCRKWFVKSVSPIERIVSSLIWHAYVLSLDLFQLLTEGSFL